MRASRRVLTFPRRLPPVWRWALIVVVTVVIALSTTNAVRAKDQPNNASKAPAEKSYILPYILVGLCMGFGIMVVCRPGNRGDKEKMSAKQEFEESH